MSFELSEANLSKSHNDIIKKMHELNISDDKKCIMKMLDKAFEKLHMNGIDIYPNVIEQFFINGFKRQATYVDIISNIKARIIEITKDNIHWVNIRSFRKANNREKNIILCFFLFIYHEHFINFLHEFLVQILKSDEKNVNNLILNLKKIVKDATGTHAEARAINDQKLVKSPIENIIHTTTNNHEKNIFDIDTLIQEDILTPESDFFDIF